MDQSIGKAAAAYFFSACIFLILDVLWIGFAAKGLYARYLGDLLTTDVNWVAALLFYLVYIGGIVLFVLIPALDQKRGAFKTGCRGGLLGLFAYGTFDLTCLALLQGWSVVVTAVDIAWGALLTATTAATAIWLTRKLLKDS